MDEKSATSYITGRLKLPFQIGNRRARMGLQSTQNLPSGGSEEMRINAIGTASQFTRERAVDEPQYAAAQSPVMRTFEQALSAVARVHVAVLLVGEPGVGKRLMARRLHQRSPYWELRLQRIVCAEAEPRAFSQGHANYDGGMQSADLGMVLLEEIADLPLPAQASLLQAMQENRGLRYVATSRKNLEREV